MEDFRPYRRKQIAELRPVTYRDIECFQSNKELKFITDSGWMTIAVSEVDLKNGSPKIGDMIARNPKNNQDQWLVSKTYFEDNFEELK